MPSSHPSLGLSVFFLFLRMAAKQGAQPSKVQISRLAASDSKSEVLFYQVALRFAARKRCLPRRPCRFGGARPPRAWCRRRPAALAAPRGVPLRSVTSRGVFWHVSAWHRRQEARLPSLPAAAGVRAGTPALTYCSIFFFSRTSLEFSLGRDRGAHIHSQYTNISRVLSWGGRGHSNVRQQTSLPSVA